MAKKKKEEEIQEIEPVASEVQVDDIKMVQLQDDSEDNIVSIERKLIALHNLQQIDSQVDKIRIVRGELPLEVEDLEDEVVRLETRIANFQSENSEVKSQIGEKDNLIKESKTMIERYQSQQMNVRNNREYESLNKEIEYQGLEIQLAEKHIKEFNLQLSMKKDEIKRTKQELEARKADLKAKKEELDDIVHETKREEQSLIEKSTDNQKYIEDRLLNAYQRIRNNARNGLAVVMVERDACGGCFSKIPPQRQLDIKMHKKIIVCEYCGRILIDPAVVEAAQAI